ncbi:MAG: GlsB/YeaQ/YmgE family stress response membrane protein, partial [Ktedonobacteraceae bacterium]|nr:GlsB/YeaQ/YmgE family stress response membrane protein [Ktedonobacteraceae bacterium]
LLGGLILGAFNIDVRGIFWTFVTALVGAIILLWIARLVTGGRGVRYPH